MAKPTRRQQPYRKGLATKMMGPAHTAMTRGRTSSGLNPMDQKRSLAKKMSGIHIPNPVSGLSAWLKHNDYPTPKPQKPKSVQIAPAKPKRKGRTTVR